MAAPDANPAHPDSPGLAAPADAAGVAQPAAPPPSWAVPGSSYVVAAHGDAALGALKLVRAVVPYEFAFETHAKARWVGRPLVDLFAAEFPPTTRAEYCARLVAGKIAINGARVTASHPRCRPPPAVLGDASGDHAAADTWPERVILGSGDRVAHQVCRVEAEVPAQPPLSIVAVDPRLGLLVVSKPCGMPVHPCGHFRHNSLVGLLRKIFYFPERRRASHAAASPRVEGYHVVLPPAAAEGGAAPAAWVADRDGHVAAVIEEGAVRRECQRGLGGGPGAERVLRFLTRPLDERARPVPARARASGGVDRDGDDGEEEEEEEDVVLRALRHMDDLHVVHRLDKCTSGVVMLALTARASRQMFTLLASKSASAHAPLPTFNTGEAAMASGDVVHNTACSGAEDVPHTPIAIEKHYLARVHGAFDVRGVAAALGESSATIVAAGACHSSNSSSGGDATDWLRLSRGIVATHRTDNLYRCVAANEPQPEAVAPAEGAREGCARSGRKRKACDPRETQADEGHELFEVRPAITLLRVLWCDPAGEFSILECLPLTGRTHQLRLHLALCGHPIVGDSKYDGTAHGGGVRGAAATNREAVEPQAIDLHAWKYVIHFEAARDASPPAPTVFEAPMPSWAARVR